MRAVVQRVTSSRVVVEGKTVGEIGQGLLVLLGVEQGDTQTDQKWMLGKVSSLRIFEDDEGKMNRSVLDIKGEVLVVSQFTLLGDVRKGNRPSFMNAADPPIADAMYLDFVEQLKGQGIGVAKGEFGADMKVSLLNDGPVTILLDSRKVF